MDGFLSFSQDKVYSAGSFNGFFSIMIVNFSLLLITLCFWENIIFTCVRRMSSLPSLYSFLCVIKDKLCIEQHVYMNRNKCHLYIERFGKLQSVL